METKSLNLDLLKLDGTQNRVAINEEVVAEYADLVSESNGKWPFPPLDIFHDGIAYHVADGFHRILGARQAKRASAPCVLHQGTATDARIFGMTANDRHGLRMTRADKRACVVWLLENSGKMTQKAIAETAGVTDRAVRMIVAELKPKEPAPPEVQRKTSGHSRGDDDAPAVPGSVSTVPRDDEVEPDTFVAPPAGNCPKGGDHDYDGAACKKCHEPDPAFVPQWQQWAELHQNACTAINKILRDIKDIVANDTATYLAVSQTRICKALTDAKNTLWVLMPMEEKKGKIVTRLDQNQAKK